MSGDDRSAPRSSAVCPSVMSLLVVVPIVATVFGGEPSDRRRPSQPSGQETAAMTEKLGASYRGALPPADDALRALAAELRQRVAHLVDRIGERNVARHARELAKAADYIDAELRAAGFTVRRQEYTVSGTTCANLEVEIQGTTRPEDIVIVGAHYDSVIGTPGANDNGSGVAALLGLARRFAGHKIERTLRFVAFVNEEPPYFQTEEMGSLVYARRCRKRGEKVTAMLALETIGYYNDAPNSQNYPQPFALATPRPATSSVSSGIFARTVCSSRC
jgi:Zn-dependent M28 family amino/carboxypeptidase